MVSNCSSTAQHADELKRMKKTEKEQLLKDAGSAPGSARSGAALAMKNDLHLPWYRKLRRWLTAFGVSMDSETTMRQQIAENLPFDLIAEGVPLADKSGDASMKPMVRFPDLPKLVHHYLNQHEKAGTLCWHSDNHDQVWVKIGGDHGGGSFNPCFQLGNVAHPNSVKNTVPFLVFAAKKHACKFSNSFHPYADQIKQLKDQE